MHIPAARPPVTESAHRIREVGGKLRHLFQISTDDSTTARSALLAGMESLTRSEPRPVARGLRLRAEVLDAGERCRTSC